jgi:transcriptional regulator with XRE-family HTH domain
MATRIRQIRKCRELTLQMLADKVGTTAQTIQRLETGNMTVSLDWLVRIANAFELQPAQLLDGPAGQVVPLVGEVGPAGVITTAGAKAADAVRVAVPGDDPMAVRLQQRLGPHEAGTILIANRLKKASLKEADGRDCIVQMAGGRMVLRRIVTGRGGPAAFVPYEDNAGVERDLDIDWVAPIVMTLRYLAA